MKALFMGVVYLAFLTGCSTLPPLSTASGLPEVSISGKNKEAILKALEAHCKHNSGAATVSDGQTLTCIRPAQGYMMQMTGKYVEEVIQYQLLPQEKNILLRVPTATYTLHDMVNTTHTPNLRTTAMGHDIQAELEAFKESLGSK